MEEFYAIDDINILRNYLELIKEKKISFILLCHYINDYPEFVKKVLTSINSVYDYIKAFGEKFKYDIELSYNHKKYRFSDDEISKKNQYFQCPVITAEEYDLWYFFVHRAYAHFFDNIDDF